MEAALGGLHLRHDTRRVVGPKLLVTHASRPGSDGVVGRFEGNGFEARWVVRPDRRSDQEEEGRTGGSHAKGALGADHGGAQVQRVAARGGDEALFHGGELGDEGGEGFAVEGGEGDARAGLVETGHVAVGAEEVDFARVWVLVGFHAFEGSEGVVEDAGGGVEAEVLVGGYSGLEPALGGGPFNGEHVV